MHRLIDYVSRAHIPFIEIAPIKYSQQKVIIEIDLIGRLKSQKNCKLKRQPSKEIKIFFKLQFLTSFTMIRVKKCRYVFLLQPESCVRTLQLFHSNHFKLNSRFDPFLLKRFLAWSS